MVKLEPKLEAGTFHRDKQEHVVHVSGGRLVLPKNGWQLFPANVTAGPLSVSAFPGLPEKPSQPVERVSFPERSGL